MQFLFFFEGEIMKFCFDCDDTLYDLQWPFKQCLSVFFPDFNGDVQEFYRIYREYGDQVFELLQEEKITVDDSGIYRIYKAAQAFGFDFSLEQACAFQEAYVYNQHHISMSTLYHTFFSRTNSELAIFTNGLNSHQRMKLKALDVFQYFKEDHVFTSGEVGFAKPNKNAFNTIAEKTNTNIEDWFYIGDNYINDIEGAKNAGMKTIHFNRHHQREGNCADYIVYDEESLIQLLLRLEND